MFLLDTKSQEKKGNIGTNSDLSWNRGKGKKEKSCPHKSLGHIHPVVP